MSNTPPAINGLELNFFPNKQFESQQPNNIDALARNILRALFMGGNPEWKKLITMRTLNAIFMERDFELAKAFRGAFQQGMNNIYDELKDTTLKPEQINQANAYINTCLMYAGYFESSPFETLNIPQFINNKWEQVKYTISHIKLTANTNSNSDDIYASCLEPLDKKAPAIMIVPGTTYPQGQGFFSALEADLEPFKTPGEDLVKKSSAKIKRWLDIQRNKGLQTHVTGTSLGGAVALLMSMEFPEEIDKVYALNPPGIYSFINRPKKFDELDKLQRLPEVNVFLQNNDEVSKFGYLYEKWNAYRVIPPEDVKSNNVVVDHVVLYTGFKDTQFNPLDIVEHNKSYKFRNVIWYAGIRSIFSFFIFKPFMYVLLPLIRFIDNKVLKSIFILPFLAICGLFAVTLNPAFSVLLLAGGLYFLGKFLISNKEQEDESLFNLANPYVKALVIAGIVILTAAAIALTIFIPPVIAIAVGIMLPVVTGICNYLVKITHNAFHPEEKPGVAHLPNMPRHPGLCAYSTITEAEFTYEQLHEYYTYRQCNIKKRQVLDGNTSSQGGFMVYEKNDQGEIKQVIKSKADILAASCDPNLKHEKVIRIASVAKIDAMQKFLFFKKHPEYEVDLHKIDRDYKDGKDHSEPLAAKLV